MEAWSSIEELREEVAELARVIIMIYTIMMGLSSPSDLVRKIWDNTVLRKLRLIQQAMLTDSGRVEVV